MEVRRSLYIIVLIALTTTVFVRSEEISGVVVGVHDGDTITVLTKDRQSIKVRLYGIDAPELRQPFGQRAKQYLAHQVFQKPVTVQVKGTDRYRRTLGIVVQNRRDINAAMVRRGYAWAYVKYSDKYVSRERQARRHRLGLWSQPNPVPPWEWRHLPKHGTADQVRSGSTGSQTDRVDVVYTTRTGTKYHRAGCRYLKSSAIPISRQHAEQMGYTPCRICRP